MPTKEKNPGFWDHFNWRSYVDPTTRSILYAVPSGVMLRGSIAKGLLIDNNSKTKNGYIRGNDTFGNGIGLSAMNIFSWPYTASVGVRNTLLKVIDEFDGFIRGISRMTPTPQKSSVIATIIKGIISIPFFIWDVLTYPLAKLSNRAINAVSDDKMETLSTPVSYAKETKYTSVSQASILLANGNLNQAKSQLHKGKNSSEDFKPASLEGDTQPEINTTVENIAKILDSDKNPRTEDLHDQPGPQPGM